MQRYWDGDFLNGRCEVFLVVVMKIGSGNLLFHDCMVPERVLFCVEYKITIYRTFVLLLCMLVVVFVFRAVL